MMGMHTKRSLQCTSSFCLLKEQLWKSLKNIFDTGIFFAHHFDHCYSSLLWFPFFCYINIIYFLFLSKHSQPNPLPTYSHSFIPEGRAPTSSQPLTVGSITHLLPFQARIFVLSPLLPPCLGRAPCSCPQSCLVILLQIPSQASS